jgi:C-terminal processing protease CtpA/Prc
MIEFRNPASGVSRVLRLSGVREDFRETIAPVRYPRDQKPESAADLKFLDSGRIAVFSIRQFAGDAGGRFFDDAFEQIQQRKSVSLIIDVRNNSGGADELGKKLLSFLVDQPFRYYDDLVLNAREFSFGRYIEGGGGVIPASMVERGVDGKFHNVQHPNWGLQQPSQPYFAGQVLALMNGGSFSTTCEFLSSLHSRKRATFIGEEAAGGYYGNTSGRMPTVILPNSKVTVRVPLQTYYLAVKGGDPRRSILPDVEVKPALQDLLTGSDPVMGKAMELAREPRQ